MKYQILNKLLLIFAVSFLVTSCSNTKNLSNSGNAQNATLSKSLLWKIEGNNISEPSYLYGTIHIINKADYFLPKGTLAAIDATDEMVFEIDMNEMNDITKQMGMLGELFMKDDLSLKDLMSAEDYKLVGAHFEKMGLPLFFFERMKPMFLTVFASSDFDPNGLQNGELKSYEMEFLEMAKEAGKEVSGLETIEFQISIFDKIPYQDQADMLVESIKHGDMAGTEFEDMIRVYKDQDIEGMITMIKSEDSDLEEHGDILIGERNRNWIPIMAEKMKTRPTFFAVGAGHLAGQDGVIRLLMQKGYKLTPISAK